MPTPPASTAPHWWTDIHRSPTANRRLGICLAFVAGATNAGGFLAIGQYTSHVTGLLSALADNLVLGQFALVASALAALGAFVGGAMTTALMVNWGLRRQLRSAYARPLALEAVLLLVFGLFGAALQRHAELFAPLTVLLLCYLMGLQNALITKVSQAEIRTTHVTGLVTDIGIELGKLVYFNRSPAPTKVMANRRKLGLHLSLVAAFFLGGVLGALGFQHAGYVTTVPLALALGLLAAGPLGHDLRHGRLAPPVAPR
ncbi:MAG: YoaK family protein [Hylemonella sp.]